MFSCKYSENSDNTYTLPNQLQFTHLKVLKQYIFCALDIVYGDFT